MNKTGKIVILHSDVAPDAGEDELDCLRQAGTVAEALLALGHEPVLLAFVFDLGKNIEALQSANPRAVFNLVETLGGKGNLVHVAPALLDYLQIPYTGCRADAMYLTSNKPLAKKILHGAGIATPPWITAEGFAVGIAPSDTYLIKASWEEGSVGLDETSIVKMTDPAGITEAIHIQREKLGAACFAEAYIDGREFNIALLASDNEVQLLPAAEMLFSDYAADKLKLLDYRAKWVEDSFEYGHTGRTLEIASKDAALIDNLRQIALRCWDTFGLRGYARVDFRVDKEGNPWVLEINANPCLSLDAGFAAAVEKAGIKYSQAIECIVNDAYR